MPFTANMVVTAVAEVRVAKDEEMLTHGQSGRSVAAGGCSVPSLPVDKPVSYLRKMMEQVAVSRGAP